MSKQTYLDTARGRLIDHAAARIRNAVHSGDLKIDKLTADTKTAIWHYLDDSARALCAQDLELELYYSQLTDRAAENLIKDTYRRAGHFMYYAVIEPGETVYKRSALSAAKGLLKVEGVDGWTLFCRSLEGESIVLRRDEVKRPYEPMQRAYLYKTGEMVQIGRLEDERAYTRPLGTRAAERGVSYADLEPTASDGLTGEVYPVSLMRPFLHPSRGWQLGIHLATDSFYIDGQLVTLTATHKAILIRLKCGIASRTMLSVAAYNHAKLLGGLAAIDIWRRQDLRQLVAGGLVQAATKGGGCKQECFELTAAGRRVADTLPDCDNPLKKPKYPDKERAAEIHIYSTPDLRAADMIRIWRGGGLNRQERTYSDKRLTKSSRLRLQRLLGRYNWEYERDETGGYYIDYYRLEP